MLDCLMESFNRSLLTYAMAGLMFLSVPLCAHATEAEDKLDATPQTTQKKTQTDSIGIGLYKKKQYAEALPYLTDDAERQDSNAQMALGNMYSMGLGVTVDQQKAFVAFAKQVDKSKVAVQKSLEETQLLFDSLMQQYFG